MKVAGCLSLLMVCSICSVSPLTQRDRSDWIDPTDMLNYDHSTGKMRPKKEVTDSKQGPDVKEAETPPPSCDCQPADAMEDKFMERYNEVAKEQLNCLGNLRAAEEKLEECNKKISMPEQLEVRFFQRYIRMLLNYHKDVIPTEETITYSTITEYTSSDLQQLRNFVSGDGRNYRDVYEVLDRVVLDVSQIGGYHPPTFAEKIAIFLGGQINLIYLTICCVSIVVAIWLTLQLHVFNYYMLMRTFFSLFLILFFISVPWNWWHLYQTELAKRQKSAIEGLPQECRMAGESVGWNIWFNFKSAFSLSEDACTKYYKDILVNPVLEVSPVMALSVTAIKFFVEPAEHIGRALNKLLMSSVTGLPFYMVPIMLGIVVLVLFLGMVMIFGYRLRGFHFFDLQPPVRHPIAAPQVDRVEQIENVQAAPRREQVMPGEGAQVAAAAIEDVPAAAAPPAVDVPDADGAAEAAPAPAPPPIVEEKPRQVEVQPVQESAPIRPQIRPPAQGHMEAAADVADVAPVQASVEEVGVGQAAGDGGSQKASVVNDKQQEDTDQTELKEVAMSESMEGFIDIQGARPLDPDESDSDVEIIQEDIAL